MDRNGEVDGDEECEEDGVSETSAETDGDGDEDEDGDVIGVS